MQQIYEQLDEDSYLKLVDLTAKAKWLQPRDKQQALNLLWNLSNSDSKKELIVDLLERFIYLEIDYLEKYIIQIKEHILDIWKLNSSNTKIVAIADKTRPDGSQTILQILKNKIGNTAGWRENKFINNILDAAHKCSSSQQLVILDDFIGTGKKAKGKTTYIFNTLRKRGVDNVKVYLCSIAAMNISKPTLDNLNIQYYSSMWLDKGISDYYGNKVKENLDCMLNLEENLGNEFMGKKLSDVSLGYHKSEALFAIDNLTVPNNVFPIFWWPVLKSNVIRNTVLNRIL